MDTRRGGARVRVLLAGLAAPVAALLVLPLVIGALPFWAVSAATRAFRGTTGRFRPRAVPWQSIIEFHPRYGWKNRANMRGRALVQGGTFGFVTDGDGWRGVRSLDEAGIVVFGDSFAFGHGAAERAYFGALHPEIGIKCIGANGYNTVQALMWMERLRDQLRDRLVALFVYYGNDLAENLYPCSLDGYRAPFTRRCLDTGTWEYALEHVRRDPWPFPIRPAGSQLPVLCCDVAMSRRAYSAMEHLIARARDVCAESGGRLVVVGIPDPRQIRRSDRRSLRSAAPDPASFDVLRPDREIRGICERAGVSFLPLSRHLTSSDYLSDDCHWTRRGHRRVADLLVGAHWKAFGSPGAGSGPPAPSGRRRRGPVPSGRDDGVRAASR